MRKLILVLLVILLSTLTGCTNQPTETEQTVKIGVLTMGGTRLDKLSGLRKGLQDLGWTDEHIDFQIFNDQDDEKKLDIDSSKLLDGRPNIVVVTGVIEADAMATKIKEHPGIPMVMVGVTSPLDIKLAGDLEATGTPVTGVDNGYVKLTAKRMELMHLLFPNRKKLILLYDPRLQASLEALREAAKAARAHAFLIEPIPINTDRDLAALAKRTFYPDESMLVLPSYFLEQKNSDILKISLAQKTPIMGLYKNEAIAGYTASYGIEYFDQGYQAASLVIQIFHEKKSIPLEMPDSVQLMLNMEAAQKLGETFSPLGLSYGEKLFTIGE